MSAPTARRPRSKRAPAGVEVVARDRAHEAHQLRLSGLGWQDIAERTGYADGRVANMAVTAWLQKIAVEAGPEARRRALDLELERLDRLQAAHWASALAGDVQSTVVILKIIDKRSSLLGLDRIDDSLVNQQRTIVIAGSRQEYVAGLRAVVEGTHPGLAQG